MKIYEFQDYKEYLRNLLSHGNGKKFAEFLGCQPAFVSQVLKGKPHLSLEQGILATDYFKMEEMEADYFILSLQLGRAGNLRLKNYFKRKREEILESRQQVAKNIGTFERLPEETKGIFFSSWKYALCQVLVSVPVQDQMDFIKNKIRLSEREIANVLEFLKAVQLIEKKSKQWHPSKKRIHLDADDWHIGNHHKNFRCLSLMELEDRKRDSLHFSSAMALSTDDAIRIKDLLLEAVRRSEAILKPSQEETVRVFCIDYFEPGIRY